MFHIGFVFQRLVDHPLYFGGDYQTENVFKY